MIERQKIGAIFEIFTLFVFKIKIILSLLLPLYSFRFDGCNLYKTSFY